MAGASRSRTSTGKHRRAHAPAETATPPPLRIVRDDEDESPAEIRDERVFGTQAIALGIAFAIALACGLIGVVVVLVASGSGSPAQTAAGAAQLAAASPPPPTASVLIHESFDDMRMGSELSSAWTVSGSRAEVVALPTSVNRSVRIGTDPGGKPTSACRVIDASIGSPISVQFDYLWNQPVKTPVRVMTFAAAGTTLAAVTIEPSMPAATLDGWHRVQAVIDVGRGAFSWRTLDRNGDETGSGQATLALGSMRPDHVCLISPAGKPPGWLAVDDFLLSG
jgi:hypothetical protein